MIKYILKALLALTMAAPSTCPASTYLDAKLELHLHKYVETNHFDFMYRYDYRLAGTVYKDANGDMFMVIAKIFMNEDFARTVKFQISSNHYICHGSAHPQLIRINGRSIKSEMSCGIGGRSAYFSIYTAEGFRIVPNMLSFFNVTTFEYDGYIFDIPTENFDKAWDALGGDAY